MKFKHLAICLAIFCFLLNGTALWAAQEKEGKIVALNSHPRTILLKQEDQVKEYRLAQGVEIKRNGQKDDFSSLRPKNSKHFYKVRIEINKAKKVEKIKAFYQQKEIKIKGVTSEQIVVEDLSTKRLYSYELTEEVSLIANNNPITIKDLKTGARGKAFFGQKGELLKISSNHYQTIYKDNFWSQLAGRKK